MNVGEIEKVLYKRKNLFINDDMARYKCWEDLTYLLTENESQTIEYLETCCKENLYYISEVFDDIAEILQSKDFIKCIKKLDTKYPELDMKKDIQSAENTMK